MDYKIAIFLCGLCCSLSIFAQGKTQNIRGMVSDEASNAPLAFATVIVLDSDPIIGTRTNDEGVFVLKDVPLGRRKIKVSYLGYEPVILPEVVVISAKETVLEVRLREQPTSLDDVVIKPRILKSNSLNSMASVSAKMLSVEEANRYAGGFNDPARLASSFAGVGSSIGNNAIVIRGNSPKFLQWKMEGVEIPNPNHFADLAALGGGGLTALSSALLDNSDFYTGAFPAEYNNALSGVFDMKMRAGNAHDFEHSFQIGAIGLDFASEGPIGPKGKASYLVNYRYSTLGLIAPLLPEDARGTNYQDLAFKLKFPSRKAGVFSLWGLGLIDHSGTVAERDSAKWAYAQDKEEANATQLMGAGGLGHKLLVNSSSFLESSVSLSFSGLDLETDKINPALDLIPENVIQSKNYNLNLKSVFNKKFGPRHNNRSGINVNGMAYDLNFQKTSSVQSLETLVKENNFSALFSAFSSSKITFENLSLNVGLTAQWFSLNQHFSLEPRFGLNYKLTEDHKLSFGYGLHSRIERLNLYFAKASDPLNSQSNQDLDFSKAHHLVVGYDWNLTDNLHLKVEPYYQYLFNIPVLKDCTFSTVNLQQDFFLNGTFNNGGKGENYGLDLTLEQYMKKGFYYLLTASVFNARYKTETDVWFNNRYNRRYLLTMLFGKEFKTGKEKQNLFGLNLRLSVQGGDYHSKIDTSASIVAQEVVYDETTPFTIKTSASVVSHVTINFKWNKKNTSQELALKVLNANNYREFLGHRFNFKTAAVEEYREGLLIPNISYKISF